MRRPLFAAALCMVILAVALLQSGVADRNKPGCIRAEQLDTAGTLHVTGQIYQKDEKSIYIKSVILCTSDASGQSKSEQKVPCQDNLICELEEALELPLGCVVELEGIFAPFSHASNPGEFDSAGYYKTLRIGGKIRKASVLRQGEAYWKIREALCGLKYYLKERLCRIMPPKEAAVMSALLLGDKGDMDSEMKELYKRNGILHILSISSLHITIIGMSVYKLLRKGGIPVCPAALAGSILLLLYGGMAGFGVSACRAIGMYLIKMLGEMAGRTYDMLTALGVMGAAMALYNPFYLQHSGFLLSFACCLGIGIFSPVLVPEKTRIPKFLSGSLFTSLSITFVTLPIQLWFYYEVPVYSILLNLLVIPFMKPMMITGILALAAPGLGWLGMVDCLILRGYEFLCGCFDKLPFHTWNPGRPGVTQIIVYYLMLFAFAAAGRVWMTGKKGETEKKPGKQKPEGRFQGKGHIRGIARWCLLGLALLELGLKPPLKNSVTFLDVGQGDCIVVRTSSGQNYLFDCGSTGRSGVGKYVLLPYLKYHGIRKIDALFLSHPDADHVNGALELFELGKENNITVRQLVLPAIEEKARQEQLGTLVSAAEAASFDRPVRITYLSAGEGWECPGAGFTCLHPDKNESGENVNAYSECFLVEFRENGWFGNHGGQTPESGWTVLLTGDVEGEGEEALTRELQRRGIREVSVLKAAHHGSRNSTSEEFLAQVTPRLTILSSGKDNRYGHPHKELLERLEASRTYILQTARSGAVTVTYKKGKIKARAYLP